MKKKHIAGLSLIELVIVILLIGIISAVGFPRFGQFIADRSFRSGIRNLVGFIRFIKNKTAITREGLTLHIDIDDGKYWVSGFEHEESSGEGAASAGKRKLNRYTSFKDLVSSDREVIHNGEVLIRFYPAGYSDGAIIHLENSSKRGDIYSIIIKPMAVKVRVEEGYVQ